MTLLMDALNRVADLGGPVVMILLAMSLIAVALVLAKLWQFVRLGVGRHAALDQALGAWDKGDAQRACAEAAAAPTHLAAVAVVALRAAEETHRDDPALRARLTGLAAGRLARLSAGLRVLDSVAQVAPLLGLFGTVLGMIEAFQGLQSAGSAVDPSALAGGIWVALLTTAVGLVVAMPASLVLTWFDGRIAHEARMAERIIDTALCAGLGAGVGARHA
ncbi:MotA/TolQ/ExbB proton channel family protein [Pararhodobacter zhoushanensis]|uniref:MotA/TolQ/ExbB proton channel family protein n=1 Tax=Pararhodobacter zhoushanensis TaxID=2479545 RepID=UPI000F8CBD49|nr:MotA/TolQ/ExbB proton channel family protein [Pararhodobacter zhoushanensis]